PAAPRLVSAFRPLHKYEEVETSLDPAGTSACATVLTLPPVAFHKDPLVAATRPVRSNPMGMGPRWKHPGARHPDISPAIPPVITRCPDVPASRRRNPALSLRTRRSHAHHDVRRRRGQRQRSSEYSGH